MCVGLFVFVCEEEKEREEDCALLPCLPLFLSFFLSSLVVYFSHHARPGTKRGMKDP